MTIPISTSTPKILIVGAGPSGLVLALSLLRNGVPVRIIEKTVHPRIGQRGAGLMPRSFEVFGFLGIADKVVARGRPIMKLRLYKPDGVEVLKEIEMQTDTDPTPACPYPNMRLCGQNNLDTIMRAELKEYGMSVDYGVGLDSFEQFADHVQVKLSKQKHGTEELEPENASYDYVIGCDGARGVVRKLLGLTFLGQTTEENFVTGDMKLEGLGEDKWHQWGDFSNIFNGIRPTEDKGVFNFIIGGAKFENHAEVSASEEVLKTFIKQHTGNRADIKIKEFITFGHYRTNIRMVDKFGLGRVFVAGDAAHIHSPTGGQGLNTGVQDAFNLGWKLSLVTKGLAPPSLLNTYSEERLPVVAEMLNITTGILKATRAAPSGDAWKRTGALKQLGVNCRWSSIVVDEPRGDLAKEAPPTACYNAETGGEVVAGDRAPDAIALVRVGATPQESTSSLFKLFDPSRHTVLVFSDKVVDYRPLLSSLKQYPAELVRPVIITGTGKGFSAECDVFEDRDGHAHYAYRSPEGASGVFVVRPDGVVGARVGGVDKLAHYFKGVFRG